MSTVRDVAKLTIVSDEPVRGLSKPRGKDKRRRQRMDRHVVPDKRVQKAAREALREGEQLRTISETEVWTVAKQ